MTVRNECAIAPDTERATGHFLARYASWLMGCGATCIRIEKNVDRIARAYGKRVEITVMPRHVQLSVFDIDNEYECLTLNTSVQASPVDFSINTELSSLSWRIADTGMPLARAQEELERIVGRKKPNRQLVLPAVALANMAFCRLFGGDAVAMCVTGLATLAGFWLKTHLLQRHVDVRAVFFICAFVSAVLGSTDMLFGIGDTPAVALGTSVLYLVPGIPLLNSFSDLLYRHYICAFGRLADAVVLTCCLSAGLCLGMIAMNAGMF
ncbi:MAG: threonine/serine exporter family protein [Muribaculaceae bacterium]|nr:threonine/serine exporter family protein [Muribaculaceae bacterium]